MNEETYSLCRKLIPESYVRLAEGAKNARTNLIKKLVEKKKIPQQGWDEETIEVFLHEISQMDSNNFIGNCGVGEREGRIYSNLVACRHYRFAHGIGRSGEITGIQPKAAGSSLLNIITNRLVMDSIHIAGVKDCVACFVVPVATGMALVLCMQALRTRRPHAKFVLWPRIDQKSCFKSIATAGFVAVVIENKLENEQLVTDTKAIAVQIENLGAENILCIMSTTSCFAPRNIDKLHEIGTLCSMHDIPHIVNNAYGVQSSKCMHVIQQAHKTSRVDVFVQSTDKNYMVPVGGSVIAGFDKAFLEHIAQTYPGRASVTPSMDLFITLMSMGVSGYRKLLADRKDMFTCLKNSVEKIAVKYGERVLKTLNPISIGVTLQSVSLSTSQLTEIGSMLFTRNVSGLRVITGVEEKTVNGHLFHGFGSHHSSYPTPYFTVAAAIGMTKQDVELFCKRLDKVFMKVYKKLTTETVESAESAE